MQSLSHSERLRQKIDLALPDFIDACNELVSHERFAELYPEMLVRMYWMIRSSVPHMHSTLSRCRELASSDDVAAAMVPYLEQHILEEMGHDEWMLEDLELLGVPRGEVLSRMPSPNAAALVGGRHYWVMYHHPVAELAGLAVMEGYPASQEAIDLMQELTGHPRAAFRTIEKHSHLDPHHRDELLALLDRLPLNESHHEILGVTAFHTIKCASALYREIIDNASIEMVSSTV